MKESKAFIFDSEPDESICANAIAIAGGSMDSSVVTLFRHNGTVIEVNIEDTADDISTRWYRQSSNKGSW